MFRDAWSLCYPALAQILYPFLISNTFSCLFFLRHFTPQVWWSPCPSRECPEEPELELAVHQCVDYCLMQEQVNPQLYTNTPAYDVRPAATTSTTQRSQLTATTARTTTMEPSSESSSSPAPTTSTTTSPASSLPALFATQTRSRYQEVLNMSSTMFPPMSQLKDALEEGVEPGQSSSAELSAMSMQGLNCK